METLPLYTSLIFGFTLLLAIAIFYKAAHGSKTVLFVLLFWIAAQTAISLSGFYKNESTLPPRFALLLLPPVFLIIMLFITESGRKFIDGLDQKTLTLLHIIRIPVELVLFWLFLHKAIPGLMTFEGRNFDVLSGLSAPIVYYLVFIKKTAGPRFLLAWNIICLALLLNVAANAVLSLPTAFQQFALEQPNIALLYFPFVLLPAVLVPMVMFSHFSVIRQIIRTGKISQ